MGSSPTSATTHGNRCAKEMQFAGKCSGPLVKRLRHRPFTAVTGVRFSHGSFQRLQYHCVLLFVFLPQHHDTPVSFPAIRTISYVSFSEKSLTNPPRCGIIIPRTACGYGGIGRRAGFRILWATPVQVRPLLPAFPAHTTEYQTQM